MLNQEFDKIFNIMRESFPENEFRCYEEQKSLLSDEKYRIIFEKSSGGDILGFLAFWSFDDFSFIEHLAVAPNTRGMGVGSKLVSSLTDLSKNPVVLEVEVPNNNVSKKRIKFYDNLGFSLNTYPYCQLPLRQESNAIPMYVMSYPVKLSFERFIFIRNGIYSNVYMPSNAVVS